jgi:PAS domain S-box-containing protein
MSAKKNQPLRRKDFDPILDSIADGVFTVAPDWTITSFNAAAERITGVPRKEALGRKCWEVFHADVCERECLLKETLRTNKPRINKTVRIVNSSGDSVPISISTAILTNERGDMIGGVETFRDLSEIEELRRQITRHNTHYDIVTHNHRMLELLDTLPAIARTDSPVLILGESGTGKELLAKAIHQCSPRAAKPFVAVNCGALPENLLESELFGYKKGAFTDAKADKPGRFDRARGGTLFLDEIGDLQKSMQVKLLRVLQEGIYEPLGATESVAADVRIIAATNHDLAALVETGEFRRDFFYRIHVLPLVLPPLRERPDDIPLLVTHCIAHYNVLYRKNIETLSDEALSIVMAHHFAGNIRELQNILQHAFTLCDGGVIEKKHLPDYLKTARSHAAAHGAPDSPEEFERRRINAVLRRNRYNRRRAAAELGMHVTTLWRKMKKLAIES